MRLETKRGGLRPREFLRWDPAPRRPFDAIKNHATLASSARNVDIPWQKKHAYLASLAGIQVIHLSVFAGQKIMPRWSAIFGVLRENGFEWERA